MNRKFDDLSIKDKKEYIQMMNLEFLTSLSFLIFNCLLIIVLKTDRVWSSVFILCGYIFYALNFIKGSNDIKKIFGLRGK